MLFAALRSNVAPRVAMLPRSAASTSVVARSMRTSAIRMAGGGSGPPILQGEGAPDGTVPTDENQSTGLERFELLGRLQGVDVFDMAPLESHRLGTLKEPIMIRSLFPSRIVGCSGSPAGSHDTKWIHLKKEHKHLRCPECGSVYKLDFVGEEGGGHGHH